MLKKFETLYEKLRITADYNNKNSKIFNDTGNKHQKRMG